MRRFPWIAVFLALVVTSGAVMAIEPVPDKKGWSGFLLFGASGIRAETNMTAGISGYSIDIGKDTITSLSESPKAETTGAPLLNLNVNYTFAHHTQLFLGNSLENVVELDRTTVIGVRQQFGDKSILELSGVTTPYGAPVAVWEDPYAVGVPRDETDRTSRGARLEYDRIAKTGFGIQYTARKIEIEDELSGTQLGLTPDEAALLDRNGDSGRLVLSYRFPHKGRNEFQIRLGRLSTDYDGEAMSGDRNEIQLTHAYIGKRFVMASNVFYWQQEYDAVNPVFGDTRDEDTIGASFFLFDMKLFNSKKWWGSLQAIWVGQDANIDFYDASSSILSLGAMYRF